MKSFAAIAVAAFAGVANAQSACLTAAEAIPACALGYVAEAAHSSFSCGIVDFQCQCSHSSALQAAIENEVISACGAQTGVQVLNAVSSVCSCASSNSGQSISLDSIENQCVASAFAIPACGLGYVAEAGVSAGGCALNDFECQCSNSAAIISMVQAPLSSACGNSANAVLESAEALCSCIGGGGSGGSSGSGSASATGSMTGSASGSAAPSATMSGTAAPTTAMMQSGSPSGGSSAMSQFTGGAATMGSIGGTFAAVIGLLAYL